MSAHYSNENNWMLINDTRQADTGTTNLVVQWTSEIFLVVFIETVALNLVWHKGAYVINGTHVEGGNLDGLASKAAADMRKKVVLQPEAAFQRPRSDFQVDNGVLDFGSLDEPEKIDDRKI